MQKINIFKNKTLEYAQKLKSTFPDLNIYLKVDNKSKSVFLKLNNKKNLTLEEIKTIETLTKIFFEDYHLKIL